MPPQDTLDYIKQLTDDLADAYELQAELVLAELDAAQGRVGDFKEYECTAWLCTTGGYYSETKPSGWDEFLHWPNLKGRDHTRQGEAMDELQAARDEYNTTSDEQLSQQEKLAKIPTDVGSFLIDWFQLDTDFARIYYPDSTSEVPSAGDSWLGANASAYEAAVGTQRRSAETARGVTGDLVSNTSSYLSEITDSVSNLTDLAIQQEDLYIDMISGLVQDYSSIGGFISAAQSLVTSIQDARKLYYDRLKEQGRQLASAVDTVIQTGLLTNDLAGIGPGGAWPGATNVSSNPDQPGCTTVDEVRSDLDWFKHHIDYWDGIAGEMATLKASAAASSRLPVIMIDMPHFSAVQSSSLNGLADALSTVIAGGHTAAEDMVVSLRQTIRNYVDNEIASASQADALFNEYFPS